MRLWEAGKPFAVDFVLGAALMVRGAAIDAVGGLDDEYWMYCEEMDWCLRLAEGGWQVYAVPAAVVIHYEGQSSRQVRWGAFVRLWRSRFRFYARHHARYGRGYVPILRLLVKVGSANQRRLIRTAFGAWRDHGRTGIRCTGLRTERSNNYKELACNAWWPSS